MNNDKLIVQVVVGYMYKVMKNGIDYSKFRSPFAAIRHGDYREFLKIIDKPVDFILSYNEGKLDYDTSIKDDEIDFAALIKSGKSLQEFYKLCLSEYGRITDSHLANEDFERVCLLELSLRMHRNNNMPRAERRKLVDIIEDIAEIKNLTDREKEVLHQGRRFINQVKRPENPKFSWTEGLEHLNQAYSLLEQKQLTIL